MLVFTMSKTKIEEKFAIDFLKSDAAKKLLQGYEFIRELETPFGIPDVVFFKGELINETHYLIKAIRRMNYSPSYAKVITNLNKRNSSSIEYLISRTGLSSNYLNKILQDLTRNNIATITRERYKLSPHIKIPAAHYISIEFKIHDWRKALTQAHRHRAFASRCWVVMPDSKHRLLKEKVGYFDRLGISVATYSTSSKKIKKVTATQSYKARSNYSSVDVLSRIARSSNLINQVI